MTEFKFDRFMLGTKGGVIHLLCCSPFLITMFIIATELTTDFNSMLLKWLFSGKVGYTFLVISAFVAFISWLFYTNYKDQLKKSKLTATHNEITYIRDSSCLWETGERTKKYVATNITKVEISSVGINIIGDIKEYDNLGTTEFNTLKKLAIPNYYECPERLYALIGQ